MIKALTNNLPWVQIAKLKRKCKASYFCTGLLGKLSTSNAGAASSNQVISNKNNVVWGKSIGVNLKLAGTVLQVISLCVDLTRQLAWLTSRNKACAQFVGYRGSNKKTTSLSTNNLGDSRISKVLCNVINNCVDL